MPTKILRPNAAGDSTQLTPYPAGSQNWDCVDDEIANEDTDYVTSPTTDDLPLLDLYNLSDPGIGEDYNIDKVTVYIRCRSVSPYIAATVRTALKTDGTVYYGTRNFPPSSYVNYSTPYAVNPKTGSAWTIAQLNALQAGVEIASTGEITFYAGRCTQVYVVVEYSPKVVIPPAFAYPPLPYDYEHYPEIPPWKPRKKKRRRLLL